MKLTDQEIEELSSMGGLAPSGGNSQPWLVDIFSDTLEIRLHPNSFTASTPSAYILGNIFSLGMFAENVRISSAKLGLEYTLNIHSPTNLKDCFATFKFTSRKSDKALGIASLYNVLKLRVTNRKSHNNIIIPLEQVKELENIFSLEQQCKLSMISVNDTKNRIAEILASADAIRMRNKKFLNAMLDEMRWTSVQSEKTEDGLDIKTLELSAMDFLALNLFKTFPFLARILPRKFLGSFTKKYLLSSSYLGCISLTSGTGYSQIFYCGQLAQRTWLVATKLGLSFHPWTILPFMGLDVSKTTDGYSKEELEEIVYLYKKLTHQFFDQTNCSPVFVFRLFKAGPPSARALRKSWKTYTNVHPESSPQSIS